MAQKTKIEWTQNTWNPVTGCTKISNGCKNCYAFRMATRLKNMGNPKYTNGFDIVLHENSLNDPYQWRRPSTIFVNSMSDLFHEKVPVEFIQKVFDVMNNTPQHTYQILTKRAERLRMISNLFDWSENIWMGVSVEDIEVVDRIDFLRDTPAAVKFISFEPLIGDVGTVDLTDINWAIVGGESGWYARPMEQDWVINIKEQCDEQGTLFYFKQWGGTNKKKAGRTLLNQTWDAMPEIQITR